MIAVVFAFIVSSTFYYVNGFKNGLRAKRWAMAGLVFGPLLLPLFSIQKHVALRRSQGFGNIYLRA
ncbi:hypothetical protein [Aestuariibacter salexigens]|uniref:hypothetical protein n=1 Tax=Aestuariibacter salexigens TaxID=226010 RepID=UPI0004146E0A|nr:hypothetical protein [Aestuariibacter salexigens]